MKFRLLNLALIISLLAGLFALPAKTLADGENYAWGGSDHKVITGTSGSYDQPVAFNYTNQNGDQAIYTASPSDSCQLQIAIPASQQQSTNDVSGKLTKEDGCQVNLTADVKIANSNSPPVTGSATSDGTNGIKSGSSSSVNSCRGGVLAWLFCPIYEFIVSSIDKIEKDVIVPFLKIDPIVAKADSPQYQIWQQVRNLADVLFILIFLLIIFGTTTSIGLDNYSIKKALPRLVAAVVLVNFSFFIVGLAIDAANITGAGVGELILAPLKGHSDVAATNLISGIGLAAGIGAVFAAAGSVLTGGILVILVGAFFTVIAVFVTLVFRQVLVTLLLIVSPLAFAAWVLPNTEHFFKHWYRNLAKALIMYPMIVALFAAGKIVGAAAVAGSGGGSGNDSFRSLISVVATLAPLFLIPATFKFAGSALLAGHGFIDRLHRGTRGKVEDSDRLQQIKDRAAQRKRSLAAGQGVALGAYGHYANVGSGKPGTMLGRGLYGTHGQSGHIKSMIDFTQNRTAAADELSKEGTSFETYQVLSRGRQWTNIEIQKAQAVGDTEKVQKYKDSLKAANYRGRLENSAFRAAAAAKLAEFGQLGDTDRIAMYGGTIKDRHGNRTEVVKGWMGQIPSGELVAKQTWNSAREGMRKITPGVTFTNLDGTEDHASRIKWTLGQNQGTMATFTPDAFEKMRDDGTLNVLASTPQGRKTLGGLLGGGGPQAGPAQQAFIAGALQNQGGLAAALAANPRDSNPGVPPSMPFAYVDIVTGKVRGVDRTTAIAIKAREGDGKLMQLDRSQPPI